MMDENAFRGEPKKYGKKKEKHKEQHDKTIVLIAKFLSRTNTCKRLEQEGLDAIRETLICDFEYNDKPIRLPDAFRNILSRAIQFRPGRRKDSHEWIDFGAPKRAMLELFLNLADAEERDIKTPDELWNDPNYEPMLEVVRSGVLDLRIDLEKRTNYQIIEELKEVLGYFHDLADRYRKSGHRDVYESQEPRLYLAQYEAWLRVWDKKEDGLSWEDIRRDMQKEIKDLNVKNNVQTIYNWYKGAKGLIDELDKTLGYTPLPTENHKPITS